MARCHHGPNASKARSRVIEKKAIGTPNHRANATVSPAENRAENRVGNRAGNRVDLKVNLAANRAALKASPAGNLAARSQGIAVADPQGLAVSLRETAPTRFH